MAGRIQRYARIKNEVLELLATAPLTLRQIRIVLLIIRESWGWDAGRSNWTHRILTVNDIAKRTGIHRADVNRELNLLMAQNILHEKDRQYQFNEHQNTWQMTNGVGELPTKGRDEVDQGVVNHLQLVGESPTNDVVNHLQRPPKKSGSARPRRIVKKDLKERSKEKDHLLTPTAEEEKALAELKRVGGYPFNEQADIELMRRLAERYPNVKVHEVIWDWCTGRIGKPIQKKENPRSQLNTWCKKRQEWAQERRSQGGSSQGDSNPDYSDLYAN